MMAMPKPVAIDRLELGIAPHRWPFAEARRDEIDAHFAARCRAVANLWNGRVLLMNEVAVAGGVVRGTFFEAGFADFLAWRDWGFPDRSVVNCFAMAALRASDGAYLLGVMSTTPAAFTFPPVRPTRATSAATPSTSSATCCASCKRRPASTPRNCRSLPTGPRWTAVHALP